MNRLKSSASKLSKRGNLFSLSPGERAGVRASVKPYNSPPLRQSNTFNSARVSQAFTVIELLVVIAVIAILASLFLPALSKARQTGWTTDCAANLHEVSLGMTSFACDNADCLPESAGSIHWGQTDPTTEKAGWMEQIHLFVGSTNRFSCPGNAQLPKSAQGPFNYFNGCHAQYLATGSFGPVKTTALIYPWAYVLGGDTAGTVNRGTGLQFDPLDADKNDSTVNCVGGAANDSITENWKIHTGGQNIMFFDGHASWYKGYNADEMTFAYTALTNWTQ